MHHLRLAARRSLDETNAAPKRCRTPVPPAAGVSTRLTRRLAAMLVVAALSPLGPGPLAPLPAGAVGEPVGTITTFSTDIAGPSDLVAGLDGNVWYVNAGGATIGTIAPDGETTVSTASGITNPTDIAAGPAGAMWFSDDEDAIGRIAPDGTVTTFTDPALDRPRAIVLGSDGNLWFAHEGVDTIGRITPAGAITTFPTPGISAVDALAAGPDGSLWFTDPSADVVGRMSTTGALTTFSGTDIDTPFDIAAGPDGNLWFVNMTNIGDDFVATITPTGTVTRVPAGGTRPSRITAGPDGNLWITSAADRTVRRVTPGGVATTFSEPALGSPRSIAPGPDGNLWFSNSESSIGRITPDGVVTIFHDDDYTSNPWGITLGPDGNLWYTAENVSAIVRITPSGVRTRFPTPGSRPSGITTGSDGNLWFADGTNDEVGRMTTSGDVTTFPFPGLSMYSWITAGPDGNLWCGCGDLGMITTSGVVTIYDDPQMGSIGGVTAGPDGALWFVDGDAIGRITVSGDLTWFSDPEVLSLTSITAGPDGNLWFTGSTLDSDAIGRITPVGDVTMFAHPDLDSPWEITAGPDGNVWFTQADANAIGRITPTGEFTFFSDYRTTPSPDIVAGPDGAMWFTNNSNGSIGRIRAVPVAVPDAPIGVTAAPADDQATITWAAPASDGGSPITAYTATSAPGGHTCTTTGALTCTVTGLTNGTAYTFTVIATNAAGTGPASTPSAAVVPTACGASAGVGPFTDVDPDHAFCGEIEWMVAAGVAGGYPDGSFKPASSVSRQAMASFLFRYDGQPAITLTEPFFADVAPSHPFYAAIQWMAESGLSTGSPNPLGGKPLFKPGSGVSRQAMASFLWRSAGEPAPTLTDPPFADVAQTSPFFDAIAWMAEADIATGTPDPPGLPRFLPLDPVSRQATAGFLWRLDQL